MAKKKSNPTVVNNIESVNMELDYDKLAEAIVKAQQKAEKQKLLQVQQEENKGKKLSAKENFKMIRAIITNKAKSNGTMTSSFLGGLMSIFFNFLSLCGIIFLVLDIAALIITAKDLVFSFETLVNNVFVISFFVIIGVFLLVIAFIFRAIANEIEKENERNYIIAVFSAVVAFVALVVSIMDVIKGVI